MVSLIHKRHAHKMINTYLDQILCSSGILHHNMNNTEYSNLLMTYVDLKIVLWH